MTGGWHRVKSGGRRAYWRRRLDDRRQATARPVIHGAWIASWRWALRDRDGTVLAAGNATTLQGATAAADHAIDPVMA